MDRMLRGSLTAVVVVGAAAAFAACGADATNAPEAPCEGCTDAAPVPDAAPSADVGAEAAVPTYPGYPDATNTGIPAGACPGGLRAATDNDVTPASGASIACVRFDAKLPYIKQGISNVTFKNCRFETKEPDSFVNLQGANVTFEDSEFEGPAGTWIRASYEADSVTVRRCDFSGMGNAFEWGTTRILIEDNYVHDFGNTDPEQHADGFQNGDSGSFVIRHNTVLMGHDVDGATSTLLVGGEESIIENNLLAGAGYTLHVKGDIQVKGNHFSTMYGEKCGVYGPVYPESLASTGVWSGNVWHDGPEAGKALDAP